MEKTKGEQRIKLLSPEEYKEQIEFVQLVDTYFESSNWELDKSKLSNMNQIRVSVENQIKEQDSDSAEFSQRYSLRIHPEDQRKVAVKINCNIISTCTSSRELSSRFWTTYAERTLPVITFPLFREYVFGISGKMGIKPIIVPLWKRDG